jgi:NAD(P)-dependent dehydrogenase (short-subunit alcohol dehydrogenase family)
VSRLVVVTGGTRGIGAAIASRFRAAGDEVLAPGRAECDVTDEEAVTAYFASAGPVDVLVNNAGVSLITPAEETSAADWRHVLEVNLTGPFLTSREFGKGMLRRGSGSIVNISSVAGLLGISDRAAYNASKHGLIGLTRTLAAEWGGRGVRVNAVCPGWVKTEMDEEDQAGGGYADADIEGRTPMGRFARPEDIARAVAFLADPDLSGYVNGHALSVDGGWFGDGSWESLRRGKRGL